jgi:hypothetical protein
MTYLEQYYPALVCEMIALALNECAETVDSFGTGYADNYRHAVDCKCSECVR